LFHFALYECQVCERTWSDTLPPLHVSWWPRCCGEPALLKTPMALQLGSRMILILTVLELLGVIGDIPYVPFV
jgi:hypothetical protein